MIIFKVAWLSINILVKEPKYLTAIGNLPGMFNPKINVYQNRFNPERMAYEFLGFIPAKTFNIINKNKNDIIEIVDNQYAIDLLPLIGFN